MLSTIKMLALPNKYSSWYFSIIEAAQLRVATKTSIREQKRHLQETI
jgi:hypothetical protein